MMHESLDDGAWFAPKRFGIGVGLPIAWQGWLLLATYFGALAGTKGLMHSGLAGSRPLAFALFLAATAVFLVVSHRHTRRRTVSATAEASLADAARTSDQDTLFLCYRSGLKFTCQPRGRAGWFALAAWTLPLLPMSLCLAWLLLRFPESVLPIGIGFSLIVLFWSAFMVFWILSRSEMIDLKALPKPPRRGKRGPGQR